MFAGLVSLLEGVFDADLTEAEAFHEPGGGLPKRC